jgi:hypothetical protein
MTKLIICKTGYEFGTGPVDKEIKRWERQLHSVESQQARMTPERAKTIAMLRQKINDLNAWRTEIIANTRPWELDEMADKEVEAVFYSERDRATKRKVKEGNKLLNSKYRSARGHKQVDAAIGKNFIKPKGPTVPNTAYKVDRGNGFIPGTDVRQRDPLPRKFERPARSGPKTGGRRGHFRSRY